ncbi:MAG: hypothetical protein N2C12_05945 [Planctomycetales bacterium]
MSSAPSPAETLPETPSAGVRTVITLLLFFHLFAVSAAIAANFGARSGLRQELGTLVRPYLRTLFLDQGYDYALIYYNNTDLDHNCQVVLNPPKDWSGDTEFEGMETIEMMPEGVWPGMRRRRYLMLALNLSQLVDGNQREAPLVTSIANSMLAEQGIDNGAHRFRCRFQDVQVMVSLDETTPSQRDPNDPSWFRTTYQADLVSLGGLWSSLQRQASGQMTQSRRIQRDQ